MILKHFSHFKVLTKSWFLVLTALIIKPENSRYDMVSKKYFETNKANDSTKKYVHALNCTMTATERTICCILENYQTESGLVVPEVLRNYMGGKEFIPYVQPKKTKKDLSKEVAAKLAETKV
jgi:glyceraldehyde-3-phosphate dehydrogenase/erythrose-4-phosphate dehydrogenase